MMEASGERRLLVRSRAAWYGFLAWLFLEQPDADFISRLHSVETLDHLRLFMPDSVINDKMLVGLQKLRSSVVGDGSRSVADICLALAVEHTRLLRGVAREYGPPPPYESLYRPPVARSEASTLAEIAELYRQAQVELPVERTDRLDYLGLELDMMRLLYEEESKCWDQGDSESAAGFAFLQHRFLQEHLLYWVPGYCQLLSEATPGFYKGVAQLLLGFLELEASTAGEGRGKSPALTNFSRASNLRMG